MQSSGGGVASEASVNLAAMDDNDASVQSIISYGSKKVSRPWFPIWFSEARLKKISKSKEGNESSGGRLVRLGCCSN